MQSKAVEEVGSEVMRLDGHDMRPIYMTVQYAFPSVIVLLIKERSFHAPFKSPTAPRDPCYIEASKLYHQELRPLSPPSKALWRS